jgi:hypothetical protein
MADVDALIARLRERAQDPSRRTDVQPTVFTQGLATLDLGSLLSQLGNSWSDVQRVVAANQEGRIDPEMAAKADQIHQDMTTPAPAPDLAAPVEPGALAAAEAELGFALPEPLRRVYLEVADGGVGPGRGILPLAAALTAYRAVRAEPPNELEQEWPATMLPVVDHEGEYDCVDVATGAVMACESDEVEVEDEVLYGMSFRQLAGSVEAWLTEWLDTPSAQEQMVATMQTSMVEEARRARERIAAMSLEERRAMGLPDEGWELVVWGGLGWEE